MKKNGFTLIELLAVIAILGILSVMIFPELLGTRNSTASRALESKLNLVKSAAIEYAEENIMTIPSNFTKPSLKGKWQDSEACITQTTFNTINVGWKSINCADYCKIIYISTLIEQGFMIGDEKNYGDEGESVGEGRTNLINPTNNSTLNFKRVCVRYDQNGDKIDVQEGTSVTTRKIVAYVENECSLDAFGLMSTCTK